ncbi:DUF5784 family protein [Halocatena pleomorpha]|uniref:Uncharacterized protein n=1 Tax=Halocatena pleomorpha TaxID=1785090 RepID=A0A3P3RD17_9EURY|nr:DUF5784 family protein [Halocatena pleomorpha]RRJ31295.1 hypothetical protein EIK79_07815 [Halocatena pleomorpha]
MAGPLRFRVSTSSWSIDRVRRELLAPLDSTFGATLSRSSVPEAFEGCRIDMDNGDFALFAWRTAPGAPHIGYWLGNTETPETLWKTDKVGFETVPNGLSRWAHDELLSDLHDQEPWLVDYPHLSWFFLPVFHSKDGRESTRAFFRDHAAGFPDAGRDMALNFYEEILHTGVLDQYRQTMAGKIGTSTHVDLVRMSAAMSEFTAAKLLDASGHTFIPEIQLDSGYALDFRVPDEDVLVEVTRPRPPTRRTIDTPIGALEQTARNKTDDQLDAHPDAVLLVDCSSFRDDQWNAITGEQPRLPHTPSVVFRARPNGSIEGYAVGELPLGLDHSLVWV